MKFFASLTLFLWEIIPFVMLHFFSVLFLFRRISKFTIYEDEPLLYTREELKLQHDPKALIKTGLYIENFTHLDTINGSFIANVIMWFKFNPNIVSPELVDLFYFDRGEILKKRAESTINIPKITPETKEAHEMLVYYTLELKYSLELSQRGFPVEGHRISIVLDNKALSAEKTAFDAAPSGFLLQNVFITNEWRVARCTVEAGFMREEFDKSDPKAVLCYPRVVFSIDCARRGKRNSFVYIEPMALIFYLSFFTLILDPDSKTQAMVMGPLLSVGVPGFIAYSYVLARVVPKVSYFTLLDQLYMLYLGATFVITVIQIFFAKLPQEWARSVLVFKKALFVFIVLFMIMGLYLIMLGPINRKPKETIK